MANVWRVLQSPRLEGITPFTDGEFFQNMVTRGCGVNASSIAFEIDETAEELVSFEVTVNQNVIDIYLQNEDGSEFGRHTFPANITINLPPPQRPLAFLNDKGDWTFYHRVEW